jgi:hypothetical protein
MFILNEKPLAPDTSFTHNGIQYPANWLRLTSWEEKEAIGISEVPDPQPVDQRFYWDTDIPKQLEDDGPDPVTGIVTTGLKTQWKQQQDQTAYTLLSPTDWYVVRQVETGTTTPVGIVSYREAVRDICEQRKLEIDAATDVPDLIQIVEFSELNWPIINT